MMARTMWLAAVALGVSAAAEAQTVNKKIGGQEFSASIEISATPDKVWSVLTDLEKHEATLGLKIKSGKGKFEGVGDSLVIKDNESGDSGTFTATQVAPKASLRVTFDPENGSYTCTDFYTLTPSGRGTRLTFLQRYTESGPQSAADIGKQVEAINKTLARIKAAAESGGPAS